MYKSIFLINAFLSDLQKFLSIHTHKFHNFGTKNVDYDKINTILYEESMFVQKFNEVDAENVLTRLKERKTIDIDQIQRSRLLKK